MGEKDVPLKVAEAKARPVETINNNVSCEWEYKKKSALQKETARKNEQQEKHQEIREQKSKVTHLSTEKMDSKHHLKSFKLEMPRQRLLFDARKILSTKFSCM